MPQFSQWNLISRFYHGLKGMILHGQLEKKLCKSKVSLESGLETHLPLVPTYLNVQ
jgi:hypothetical protein